MDLHQRTSRTRTSPTPRPHLISPFPTTNPPNTSLTGKQPHNALPPHHPGLPGTIRAPPPSLPRHKNHNKIPLPSTTKKDLASPKIRLPTHHDDDDEHHHRCPSTTRRPNRLPHIKNLQPHFRHLSQIPHQQSRRSRPADHLARETRRGRGCRQSGIIVHRARRSGRRCGDDGCAGGGGRSCCCDACDGDDGCVWEGWKRREEEGWEGEAVEAGVRNAWMDVGFVSICRAFHRPSVSCVWDEWVQ